MVPGSTPGSAVRFFPSGELFHGVHGLKLNACKDIGLTVNTRKTKYMEIGRHQGIITNKHTYQDSNIFKYVSCTDGKISVRIIFFYLFPHPQVVLSSL